MTILTRHHELYEALSIREQADMCRRAVEFRRERSASQLDATLQKLTAAREARQRAMPDLLGKACTVEASRYDDSICARFLQL